MRLGRVCGTVVSTVKAERLASHKLLLVAAVDAADPGSPLAASQPFVATDLVGAGEGEVVLVAEGSAARVAGAAADVPTDAAVVGIVDTVRYAGRSTFVKS